MVVLRYCFIREDKMNFNLLKIVKSLFLIWMFKNYDDMGISDEASEIFFFIDKIPNVINNRLLATYELHDKGVQKGLSGALSQNIYYNQKMNEASGISTHEQLGKTRTNNAEIYKKSNRQMHVKKSGLSKLNDNFEKKIFDKMDLIYELANNRKKGKNSLNKVIFNKFFIKTFLFGLLPISGLIFLMLFNGEGNNYGILNWCKSTSCTENAECKSM